MAGRKKQELQLLKKAQEADDGIEIVEVSRGLKVLGSDGKVAKSDGTAIKTSSDGTETVIKEGDTLPTVSTSLSVCVPMGGKKANANLIAFMKRLDEVTGKEGFAPRFVVECVRNEIAGQTSVLHTGNAGDSLRLIPRLRKLKVVKKSAAAGSSLEDWMEDNPGQSPDAKALALIVSGKYKSLVK